MALGGLSPSSAAAQSVAVSNTWVSTTNGSWGVASNWLPATVPVAGLDTVLQFNNAGAASYSALQDLATNFQLNGLIFASTSTGTATVNNAAGNNLTLVANAAALSPFLFQNGTGAAFIGNTGSVTFNAAAVFGGGNTGDLTVGSPVTFGGPSAAFNGFNHTVISGATALPAAGAFTIAGNGLGNSSFLGPIGGTVSSLSINVPVPGPSAAPYNFNAGSGVVSLGAANTFLAAGGVALQGGNLALGTNTSLGAAGNPLTISGGTLRTSSFITVPNAVVLNNADLTFTGINSLTLTGTVSGATGGLRAVAAQVTLQNSGTYAGATTVGLAGLSSATVELSSTATTHGRILNSSSLALHEGSLLRIDNTVANSARLPAVPVTLNGRSGLTFNAGAGVNAETTGVLTVNGAAQLAVAPAAASTSATLNFAGLSRPGNDVLFLFGNFGAPSATTATVNFGAPLAGIADPSGPAGGTNLPVIPFVGANADPTDPFPRGFVTPLGNGVRTLAGGEYSPIANGSPLVPNTNNRIVGDAGPAPIAAGQSLRVNSLRIDHGVPSASPITGAAGSTLQVFSGAVAVYSPANFTVPTLAFGANAGYFHLGNNATVASSVQGSGGVVVSAVQDGANKLTFIGPAINTFTGGLTVNGNAVVEFSRDNQLGAANGPITFGGGALRYAGAGNVTLARELRLGPAGGTIDNAGTGSATPVLTVNTTLTTGGGHLSVMGTGPVELTGANASTGPTIVTGTTLRVSSVASLGAGPVILNSGALRPLSDAAPFVKDIIVNSTALMPAAIDVGGLNPTFAGVLSSLGLDANPITPTALTKTGTGTLTLAAANTLTSRVTVSAGGLTLNGGGRLNTVPSLILASGTTLTVDNTATNLGDRLGGAVTMRGANLVYRGHTAGSLESVGSLNVMGNANFVSLQPAAGASVQLTAMGYTTSTGTVLFRGPGLGTTGANTAQMFFTVAPTLTGGLIPGALGDLDPVNGAGSFLVGYSAALGVVPAALTGPVGVIQNAAPTNLPTAANVLTSASTVTRDAANTINSLTLAPGTTLSADTPAPPPAHTLNVTSGTIFSQPGAASSIASTVNLTIPANVGYTLLTTGNLTIGGGLSGGNGNVSKGGAGTLTLNAPVTLPGQLAVTAGTLALNNSSTVATIAGSGNLALGSGITLGLTGVADSTFGGIISGTNAIVNHTGTGTLALNAANTFSGGLNSAGTLETNDSSGFGAGPVRLTNASGQTLRFNLPSGSSASVGNDIQFNAAAGATVVTFTEATRDTTLTLGGRLTGTTGGTLVLAPPQGANNVIRLTGANTFTGTVQVFEGFLAITGDGSMGNPANVLNLNATAPGGLRFDGSGINVQRPVSVTFSQNTIDTNTWQATISGVLSGGFGVIVAGGGELTLANPANTHTGTVVVNAGTRLIVTGSVASDPTNAITVNGVLGGTGTINRRVAINSGGELAPGRSPGILTVTNQVAFSAGSRFAVELNGPAPGNNATNHDQLLVTGTGSVFLNGATLSTTLGYAPAMSDQLVIISGSVNGMFAGLNQGTVFQVGTFADTPYAATITYGPTSVVLSNFQPVPEPACVLVLCASAAGAAHYWRRRRRSGRP